jgi:chaperone modulatory protein CbpM
LRIVSVEAVWREQTRDVSLAELVDVSGLSAEDLQQLVDRGALEPLDMQARDWSFASDCLRLARTASRLRRDFELDSNGLALALALLDRVRALEEEVTQLRARMPEVRR